MLTAVVAVNVPPTVPLPSTLKLVLVCYRRSILDVVRRAGIEIARLTLRTLRTLWSGGSGLALWTLLTLRTLLTLLSLRALLRHQRPVGILIGRATAGGIATLASYVEPL